MNKKITFVGLVLVAVVLAAFLFSSFSASGLFGLQGALPALKVGVIGVLSGPIGASWGIDAKNGVELAVEKAKSEGVSLELFLGDSEAKPETGLSEFKRINEVYSPDVFIVEASAVASAIAPIAKDYNKPILFTAVASEGITKQNDLLFRNFYLCEEESPFMAEKAFNNLGIKRVAVLFQKEPFGESCSKIFIEKFLALGGEVVLKDSFLPTNVDFKTQLSKVGSASVDAVYAVGYENQMLNITKQMKELGINKTIIGSRLIFTPAIRNEIIKYINPPEVYFSSNDFYLGSPQVLSFREKFVARFGHEPSHVAAYAYDSVLLIAEASKISKQKGISLAEALKEAKVDGVNGALSFNSIRETTQPTYLLTIDEDGQAKKVE